MATQDFMAYVGTVARPYGGAVQGDFVDAGRGLSVDVEFPSVHAASSFARTIVDYDPDIDPFHVGGADLRDPVDSLESHCVITVWLA